MRRQSLDDKIPERPVGGLGDLDVVLDEPVVAGGVQVQRSRQVHGGGVVEELDRSVQRRGIGIDRRLVEPVLVVGPGHRQQHRDPEHHREGQGRAALTDGEPGPRQQGGGAAVLDAPVAEQPRVARVVGAGIGGDDHGQAKVPLHPVEQRPQAGMIGLRGEGIGDAEIGHVPLEADVLVHQHRHVLARAVRRAAQGPVVLVVQGVGPDGPRLRAGGIHARALHRLAAAMHRDRRRRHAEPAPGQAEQQGAHRVHLPRLPAAQDIGHPPGGGRTVGGIADMAGIGVGGQEEIGTSRLAHRPVDLETRDAAGEAHQHAHHVRLGDDGYGGGQRGPVRHPMDHEARARVPRRSAAGVAPMGPGEGGDVDHRDVDAALRHRRHAEAAMVAAIDRVLDDVADPTQHGGELPNQPMWRRARSSRLPSNRLGNRSASRARCVVM
ncbi:MAG: hypothetical protein H7840_09945 [Alphaproteobacteria bacterium]